jgi:hypothetical protein
LTALQQRYLAYEVNIDIEQEYADDASLLSDLYYDYVSWQGMCICVLMEPEDDCCAPDMWCSVSCQRLTDQLSIPQCVRLPQHVLGHLT